MSAIAVDDYGSVMNGESTVVDPLISMLGLDVEKVIRSDESNVLITNEVGFTTVGSFRQSQAA